MIAIELEDPNKQLPPAPGLAAALEFLRRPGARELADGKYAIDGERVFALVQRYSTAEPAGPLFEAHRKYIDVQFIAAGAEVVGWAPLGRMDVTEIYDPQKDVCFGRVPGGWTPLRLEAGPLAVLWPEDAHAPRLAAGAPSAVTKIVVKVAV